MSRHVTSCHAKLFLTHVFGVELLKSLSQDNVGEKECASVEVRVGKVSVDESPGTVDCPSGKKKLYRCIDVNVVDKSIEIKFLDEHISGIPKKRFSIP